MHLIRLMRCMMGEREDANTSFIMIETIRRKLTALSQVISNYMLKGMILPKLPLNYETLVTITESDDDLKVGTGTGGHLQIP